MSDYSAPLADIRFALQELAGLADIATLPAYEEATPDIINAVLDEAADNAAEVLAPLNQPGDETGSRLVDGEVVTPEGFADAYRVFVESAWQSLPCNPDHGGQGLPQLLGAAVNEMWHSANMSFALCPMLTESAIELLENHASKELNELYTPRLVSGEWTGAMDLTEPQAGSDLAVIKTKAVPDGDQYRISGQKIFITWGDHDMADNIVHLVLARLPDAPPGIKGISLFLVPKFLPGEDGTPGERNDLHAVSLEHKLGIHASPTCVMSFGENGGATGYLVGEENNGVACMFTMMNHARLAVGMQGLSISERAYQHALEYAKERIQGRIPGKDDRATIIHHADVRRMLMTMKAGTEAMRALCYITAASLDYKHHAQDEKLRQQHKENFALLTPVVKAWCTELAQELTSLGIQVHGGMGYVEETGAAQFFRDARITNIYEGTTGIQARDLAERKLLRDKGAVLQRLLGEIRELMPQLADSGNNDIRIIHRHFEAGIKHLEEAADWLLANHDKNEHNAGAASYHFLMLTGTVLGGWQMARASLKAAAHLESNDESAVFYSAKITTARFYAEHILTRSHYYLQSIQAGSDSMMGLEIDQF
ncbi:MAG: acyl-CoA dehydrogenase [Gammaproteobacteria bacterium]